MRRLILRCAVVMAAVFGLHWGALQAEQPVYGEQLGPLMFKFFREMELLYCFGPDDIRLESMEQFSGISISFEGYLSSDVNRLRQVLVSSEKRLLEYLNGDEELRSYMKEYPFKAKSIDITMSFYDLESSPDPEYYVSAPSIASVRCLNGLITYFKAKDPKERAGASNLEEVHRETFEEACVLIEKLEPRENIFYSPGSEKVLEFPPVTAGGGRS